jgi:6-phosphogluconolactonase
MADLSGANREIGRRPFLGMVGMGVLTGAGTTAAANGPARSGQPTVPAPRPAAHVAATRPMASGIAYIGGFTSTIGIAELDTATGGLTGAGTVSGVQNPSFLARSADGRFMYAVADADEGRTAAFSIGADGGLTWLGDQSSEGVMSTHLSIHPSGKYLLVANYGSGSTVVFPINANGTLSAVCDQVTYTGSGPDPSQEGPHAHMVVTDPGGRYQLVPDLGADVVHVHTLDTATGKLSTVADTSIRSGAGPRHLAFHPKAPYLYLVSELDATVTVCGFDAETGALTPQQVLPAAPAGGPKNAPAEIAVSKDARFVYVSNRGPNSVSIFTVEEGGKTLRALSATPCGGDWPRHLVLDASGTLLLVSNQNSGTVTSFRVDPASGGLTSIGQPYSSSGASFLLPPAT